jgi:sec-independent protein translocase protein TatB
MFNVGGGEILVILLVALVVLGPDRLPGAMRSVGNMVGEVRKLSNGFQAEVRSAMYTDDRPTNQNPMAQDPAGQTPTPGTEVTPESSDQQPLPPADDRPTG